MAKTDETILIWLPSPMGDVILCTPALKAIRKQFVAARIAFFGNETAKNILMPTDLCDFWIDQQNGNFFKNVKAVKKGKFNSAVLFKNSFGSALAVWLARIPARIGYGREARGFLLTDKLYPARSGGGSFAPISMIDYYLALASWLGADTEDRHPALNIDINATKRLYRKFPELNNHKYPLVILVPGGAFGPSKCWPASRFAQTAQWLIDKFQATVIISVAPNEKDIAVEISRQCKGHVVNLAEKVVNLSELKSLFSLADLVVTNDTGPRHLAIALNRKVITLFGPNDPRWTETNYKNETKLVTTVACAPCQKPVCPKPPRICMEAISVETVCDAAEKLIKNESGNL